MLEHTGISEQILVLALPVMGRMRRFISGMIQGSAGVRDFAHDDGFHSKLCVVEAPFSSAFSKHV